MLPRHHAWSLADLASDSLHLVSQVCLQPTFHYYDCIQKSILVTVLSAQLLFFFNYEKFIFVCICIHIHVLSRSVTHNSLRPHRLQSARLLCPWDFPGKNIRVGCHFLLRGSCRPGIEPMSSALAGGFFTLLGSPTQLHFSTFLHLPHVHFSPSTPTLLWEMTKRKTSEMTNK